MQAGPMSKIDLVQSNYSIQRYHTSCSIYKQSRLSIKNSLTYVKSINHLSYLFNLELSTYFRKLKTCVLIPHFY